MIQSACRFFFVQNCTNYFCFTFVNNIKTLILTVNFNFNVFALIAIDLWIKVRERFNETLTSSRENKSWSHKIHKLFFNDSRCSLIDNKRFENHQESAAISNATKCSVTFRQWRVSGVSLNKTNFTSSNNWFQLTLTFRSGRLKIFRSFNSETRKSFSEFLPEFRQVLLGVLIEKREDSWSTSKRNRG